MPKISNYTQVSASKLADKLVCDQEDSGVTSTKSVSIEQIGNAVNALQVRSDLDTQAQTIVSAINEIASYTPVYNNTASGAIATFDTSLALPLQDCTIAINAVQESGTPTPSSPKLISGFTGANITDHGKNYWNETIRNGYYNSSTGAFVPFASCIANDTPIKVMPNTTYYGYSGNYTISAYYYDKNMGFLGLVNITNRTFTTPNDCAYINFCNSYGAGGTYSNDISINTENDTAYHAYNSTTTAITWQSEAGTVYGGSLDVTTGVLTVTHKFITFDFTSTADIGGGYRRKSYNLGADKAVYPPTEENPQICNVATYKASYAEQSTHFYCGTDNCNIILPSDTPTSTTIEVVYELVTPTTYQLTPTQISAIVGTNNIFTDTNGNTSVVFACSLKDYIEGQ